MCKFDSDASELAHVITTYGRFVVDVVVRMSDSFFEPRCVVAIHTYVYIWSIQIVENIFRRRLFPIFQSVVQIIPICD